jgi:chromosomal replication initiator protein
MAVQQAPPEEITRLWERVLSSLREQLEGRQTFDTWFAPIVPREISPHVVELEVPNAFFVDWIHEHHLPTLRRCLTDVLGAAPEVRFAAASTALEPVVIERPAPADAAPARSKPSVAGQLVPRLNFDTFVVGSNNRFSHAASMAVAGNPGEVYNPLFIFGGSGLGKTHLLHSIGHAVRDSRPAARVQYVPAERFTNELIWAIQHGQTLAFRNRYRSVDVLLIDDIQFIAGKESTQEEFFYTFNALRDAHKQVVVTADKAPKDIPQLEERLLSRFNQGLVADVQMPDLETRVAILRRRAEMDGVMLPEDVVLFIADRIRNNVRDLEGCFMRLLAVASLGRQEITHALAEEVLNHYVHPEPDELTPARILTAVAERFNVPLDALSGKRRTRKIAQPRQIAMYLMRQLTDLSLVEIGSMFGGRDHSTVLYACAKVGELATTDNAFAERLNALFSTLATG